MAIRERVLGESHPGVADALNNLALVYWTQRRYSEAEGLYKRALAILEKALGANHPDVAWTLNDLALVYRDQGKYGEAEALFKRALTIREKALGASHAQVGKTGRSSQHFELVPKILQLFHEAMPKVGRIAVLVNAPNPLHQGA